MSETSKLATPWPDENPVDLSRYIDHIGAPMRLEDWEQPTPALGPTETRL